MSYNKQQLADCLSNSLVAAIDEGRRNKSANVFKIFTGSLDTLYCYQTYDDSSAPYSYKTKWIHDNNIQFTFEQLYGILNEALVNNPDIKICRLTKKANGLRLRFADEQRDTNKKLIALLNLKSKLNLIALERPEPLPLPPSRPVSTMVKYEKVQTPKEEKKGQTMESFSLTNLRDALVDKVTHLDRKTVMILAIIVLLLLIVGKYQTIKDILIGIKNKVKCSKNFKAMVEDGTNAINSLKKIIGVKDKEVKADEA